MGTKAEREFKMLTAKKQSLFSILQTMLDLSKKLNVTSNLEKFKNLYLSMDSTYQDFVRVVDNINLVGFEIKDDFSPNYSELQTANEICCYIRRAAENLDVSASTSTSASNIETQINAMPILPKIELPDFSGDVREWETFYSIFKTRIHDNKLINNVDKMHYLIGRLKGSARSLCTGISLTGENYDIVWQILIDKYQDKRYLANSYLDQIFEFKASQTESGKNLNLFLEKFDIAVKALKKLDIPDLSDFILLHQALLKLDLDTVKAFEMSERGTEIPSYDSLVKFVREQSKLLPLRKSVNMSSGINTKSRNFKTFFTNSPVKDNKSKPNSCIFCHKVGHYINRCYSFKDLNPSQRYDVVKNNNWCFNCLSNNHGVKQCTIKRTCTECDKKHHYLLHPGRFEQNLTKNLNTPTLELVEKEENVEIPSTSNLTLCSFNNKVTEEHDFTMLSTVEVLVQNSRNKNNTARFILDSGSQSNLLTLNACERLGLKPKKVFASIEGLGKSEQSVKGAINLVVASRHNKAKMFNVKMFLVNNITDKFPDVKLGDRIVSDFNDLELADSNFHIPGKIDGIIGAELYPFIIGSHKIIRGTSAALETVFGYVISGKTSVPLNGIKRTFFSLEEELSLSEILGKFWELEQVPKRLICHPDDAICEKIYRETVSRNVNGRFTVALPFKLSSECLGESKQNALSRFNALEKRLNRDKKLRQDYNLVMQDFLDQDHMRLVQDTNECFAYYISHHPVIKSSSSSTPVRVVLDASSPSDNGLSLNDLLFSGPKLQTDITRLLINFRLLPIALTADIKQMYRQINVIEDHWKWQRLFFRFSPLENIKTYEIKVVAFGVKSSPYLALRTVQELVEREKERYPLAANFALHNLYMDDFICSVHTENEAYKLFLESVNLFLAGGFDLTKWSTNSKCLLDKIPQSKRLMEKVSFKADSKVLGIQWCSTLDVFGFSLSTPVGEATKRNILSTVARCYDPLGLIAPFILFLKLLIKRLWSLNLSWDEEPPIEIINIWNKLKLEWEMLKSLQILRYVGTNLDCPTMIVGFADASQDGYGAVVYVRTINSNGNVNISLLCAKSKVSPMKITTIPRLELCAALLLSSLIKQILEVLAERILVSKLIGFSDSSTVIQWLLATELKEVFVANRIAQIKGNTPEMSWRHVDGKENPADCLSRGLTPSLLLNNSLWFHGPQWLKKSESQWPVSNITFSLTQTLPNERVFYSKQVDEEVNPFYAMMERISSWSKILKVMVWVLRFLKKLPRSKDISVLDLLTAEKALIKIVQRKHFQSDILMLTKSGECSPRLRKLHPFLSDGLLRVGGRLNNTKLSFRQKHPFILASKDILVTRLIDFNHEVHLHSGTYLLEAILRQKYWILGGRSVIRQRIHKCNRCFRLRPTGLTPLMADLPDYRVSVSKAFLHCGVDYFGPFNITLGKKRGASVHKAYVCLFVCMNVKAVHLELASSLSTSHFLLCFKRFLARRGPCNVLYSDRGTNFVGAKSILKDLNKLINSEEFKNTLSSELNLKGVEWRFNTPSSPHMGGLWESNVKAAKNHIYRVLGDQLLTYEEFSSLLVQVEALLNSRPLCILSNDPTAPEALTPAHFLTLQPLQSLPAENVTEIPLNRLDRFQLIDRMVQDYWKRWSLEYLTGLQVRLKWSKDNQNIDIGSVVVLKENTPPLHWPLAIVTHVYPGKDGVIRNVTVKTNKGSFNRPVVKICPLPSQ